MLTATKIFCFGVTGLPLSDAACDLLFRTACRMAKKGQEKARIVNDDAEGVVTTEFEHACLGSFTGMVFDGDVSTPQGVTSTRFLVRYNDLEGYEKAVRRGAKWKRGEIEREEQ